MDRAGEGARPVVLDELSGGWLLPAFLGMLSVLVDRRVGMETVGLLRARRIVGTTHPKELCETLWVVRDKEALRAWAAAVRLGADSVEVAGDFSRKEAGHGDHEADGAGR